jgi:GNAT superfamily N-acetyltransferase
MRQAQELKLELAPKTEEIDFLTEKINQERPDFGKAYPFAFFIRNDEQKIIAGCNGSVIFGAIYTDQLWVDLPYRKNGLARQLMEAVHDFGRQEGCKMATISSMSFQEAQGFYKKLGYSVDFERSGYSKNSSAIFMKKEL